MIKYRIVLIHEHGFSVLENGINSKLRAYDIANRLAKKYGEGQQVIVEEYMAR